MAIIRNNATVPIPFRVVVNGGDFRGAEGLASLLIVKLSKSGKPEEDARGEVAEGGSGNYWLLPNPTDADTVGPVSMVVIPPPGFIAEPVQFEVVEEPWWQMLLWIPKAIVDTEEHLRVLRRNLCRLEDREP